MPQRLRASVRTGIRRAIRSTGYDLVPFAAGFNTVRTSVLRAAPALIDVGANVGQYGEKQLDAGYDGRLISFEPGSDAFRVLKRKTDRHPQWDARQVALGAKTGTSTLHLSANSVSSSLLAVGDRHLRAAPRSRTTATEDVPVSTLDVELSDIDDAPLYLKLDVQGMELDVLRGGEQTIERTAAVQVEVSFDALYEGQTDWLDLCRYLQERGFLVRYIENGYEDRETGYLLQADLLFVRDTERRSEPPGASS